MSGTCIIEQTDSRRRHRGVTLVELVIGILILSLLVSMAAPSFVSTVKNNRLATQINEFVGAFAGGRSEAVKRGLPISVCTSADGASCTTSGDWSQGWLLFTDDGATPGEVDGTETVLLVHNGFTDGKNTLNSAVNRVTFNSRGFITSGLETFTLCDDRGAEYARGVILAPNGRLMRTRDTDDDGTENKANGDELTCP